MEGIGSNVSHDFYYLQDVFGNERIGPIMIYSNHGISFLCILDVLSKEVVKYDGQGFSSNEEKDPMFMWFPGIRMAGMLYEKPPFDMSWIGDMIGVPGAGANATIAHSVYVRQSFTSFIEHEIVWKHADRGRLLIENDPELSCCLKINNEEEFIMGGNYGIIARLYAMAFPWIYAMANPSHKETHKALRNPDWDHYIDPLYDFPDHFSIEPTLDDFIEHNHHLDGIYPSQSVSLGGMSGRVDTLPSARKYFERFYIGKVVVEDYAEFMRELEAAKILERTREGHPRNELEDRLQAFLSSLKSRNFSFTSLLRLTE